VQLNSDYIVAEKPIMHRILEGEWGIRKKPAFIAVAERLVFDLGEEGGNEAKWALECCNTLKITGRELAELVPTLEAISEF
jgi:hypothetical protein